MNLKKALGLVCLLASCVSTFSSTLTAQGTARLSGKVTDAQGAAIVNAPVTLTNAATNSHQTVETNSDGAFVFPLVTVGGYELTVNVEGFSTWTNKSVKIDIGAAPVIIFD